MAYPKILHLRLTAGNPPGDPVLEPDSRGIKEFCATITPHWHVTGTDVYLDLTGSGRMLGWGVDGPGRVCALAVGQFPLQAAGVGPTLLAARLASLMTERLRLRGVLMVSEGSVGTFLAPFPVNVLPQRPAQVRRLRELGVRTLGDLQVVPRALLRAVFGADSDFLAAEAQGTALARFHEQDVSDSPVQIIAGARLSRPLTSGSGLGALLDGLAIRALAHCPGGPPARLWWQLRRSNLGQVSRQVSLVSSENGSLAGWRRLLRSLWQRLPESRQGLVQLELRGGPLCGGSEFQGSLFPVEEKDGRLARTLARINRRPGPRVGSASEQLLSRWGINWYGAAPDS